MSARPFPSTPPAPSAALLSAALPAWLAAAFLLLVALAAAFGPMLGLQDPYQIDAANLCPRPPGSTGWAPTTWAATCCRAPCMARAFR